MADLILGIDPGLTGALALYDKKRKELFDVIDMPVQKLKASKYAKERLHLNLNHLKVFLKQHSPSICGTLIEEVGAAPNQGVVSTFRFGFVTGIVHGVVGGLIEAPIATVRPSIWKVMLGLSQDKTLSRNLATQTFPTFGEKFKRVKDDGRAEAALIAKFGERIFV